MPLGSFSFYHILLTIRRVHMITKQYTLIIGLLILVACKGKKQPPGSAAADSNGSANYTVAAYYFPNYHVDDRNEKTHGKGWTEWELVKNAEPRFAGHQQPKVPLWGYTDEADPAQMAQKIDAASSHGIDAFIFDWYYYNDGLFLERALEEGFFGAPNNDQIKFALMWANHDWVDIHPVSAQTRKSNKGPEVLYPGAVTPETWDRMTDYIIDTYFMHPSYWKIDGDPYFSIYDLTKFIESFGSIEATADAIIAFREKVKAAGFNDIHLNAVVWGRTILPSEEVVDDVDALLKRLGFDSATSYVWIHHVKPDFPQHPYRDIQKKYFSYARTITDSLSIPYFPNVTMGWDSSPRAKQSDDFKELGYPFMGTITDNTPNNFKKALQEAKQFMSDNPEQTSRILNINCWNEWTEGSYLEPDTTHGMAYLEAVKSVFGKK